jgi:hypothetical protein
MHVTYKTCELCSHQKVCALRERYDSVIEKITDICAEVEYSDEDFSANIDCKHFVKGQLEIGFRKENVMLL